MRGRSGAVLRPDGSAFVGPIRIRDGRAENLRELLIDLTRPGLCFVLGAGASHGVVPMRPGDIAALGQKMLRERGSAQILSDAERAMVARNPEVQQLVRLLEKLPGGAWDRFLLRTLTPGRATVILSDIFTPSDIPKCLIDIFGVVENQGGVIVSYNYDRIADRQTRFRVIAPHGRRPILLQAGPRADALRKVALDFGVQVPTDWHLLRHEDHLVRLRPEYQQMLAAWRTCRTVVFVGYGFGAGADALSFADFGRNLAPEARVHVLGPPPDNADLVKQVGFALAGRPRRFRVYAQPFRWRAFTEAVLEVVRGLRASSVAAALGKEEAIGYLHDRR